MRLGARFLQPQGELDSCILIGQIFQQQKLAFMIPPLKDYIPSSNRINRKLWVQAFMAPWASQISDVLILRSKGL